jgi:hypothetical protein
VHSIWRAGEAAVRAGWLGKRETVKALRLLLLDDDPGALREPGLRTLGGEGFF